MSVIIKDMDTEKIKILCKGADSVIKARLDTKCEHNREYMERTQTYVDDYANEGLRTLLLAERTIAFKYYHEWNIRWQ